jgi:hypothetical protein
VREINCGGTSQRAQNGTPKNTPKSLLAALFGGLIVISPRPETRWNPPQSLISRRVGRRMSSIHLANEDNERDLSGGVRSLARPALRALRCNATRAAEPQATLTF